MKKILLLISSICTLLGFSQNSILLTNTNSSSTVAANGAVYLTTNASSNTNIVIDIKNTSATTQTYIAVRYDAQLNSGAAAYFCFAGSCFGPGTVVSGSLVLGAGQSASQATVAYTMLTADMDEGPTVGQSIIKYSFKNAAVASDSAQISLKYNYGNPASVKEIANPLKSFDISPNPANDFVNISLNHSGTNSGEISLINALGQTVYTKHIILSEGKNKVSINVNELPIGIYFAKVKSGDFVSTKKLTVQ